jgi:peroxiredoxin
MNFYKSGLHLPHLNRVLVMGVILMVFMSACGAPTSGALQASGPALGASLSQPELPKQDQAAETSQQSAQLEKSGLAQGEINGPQLVQKDQLTPEQAAVADAAPVAAALEVSPAGAAPLPAAAGLPLVEQALDVPEGSQVGQRAPAFSLRTLDGSQVQLSDLVGRPLIITYWATWCDPCRRELPVMQRVLAEYQDKGLVIVTINAITQDSVDKVQASIGEMGLTLPVLLDDGNQFSSNYGTLFFPTTYFVSPNGVIQSIALGDSSEEDFRARVESLLSQSY